MVNERARLADALYKYIKNKYGTIPEQVSSNYVELLVFLSTDRHEIGLLKSWHEELNYSKASAK